MLRLLNGLDEKTLAYIRKAFEESNAEIVNIASNCERGVTEFFSLKEKIDNLLSGVDPWTRELWPDVHYKKIYFNPGHAPGDVKFLWEFMKHNFLIALGKAYRLTSDIKYVEIGVNFIKQWLDSVADDKGVSWAGHPHICQRITNWLFFLELAEGSKCINPELQKTIDAYLNKQWVLLEKEYERPINNHKLLSLSFVILGRLYRNREEELRFWLDQLQGCTERLFFADGGFAEQSTSYHRFSVESLMLVAHALKNAGYDLDSWLCDAITRSLNYFDAITDPSGKIPVFGDNSDEILFVRDWPEQFWDMEYLFAFGHSLGLCRPATTVPPSGFWLLGTDNAVEVKKLFQRPQAIAFERTGHYVLRAKKSYVFFRAGEFGFYVPGETRYAHSHCDQLGLVAYLDGTEVLADPGTYRYNENDYERMIMKDESFHSTIKINGTSQAKYVASFVYEDAIDAIGSLEDNILYGSMKSDSWAIKRKIELTQKQLIITDHIIGDVEIDWFFALGAFLTPQKVGEGRALFQAIGSLNLISLDISEPLIPEILPGYISIQYNRATPSQRLHLKTKTSREKTVRFSFQALGNDLSSQK